MANILALAGPGSTYRLPEAAPTGFFAGLWHGAISGVAFLVSLALPQVRMYETRNRGRLYDFGFIWGVCLTLSVWGKTYSASIAMFHG